MILGFVHTVPALAQTFDALAAELEPGAERVHVSDAWLLDTAMQIGITDEVHRRLAGHAEHLLGRGADAVLVTCSSVGAVAEQVATELGRPVVRVDVAMARRAVELAAPAGTVVALATASSTLRPTTGLLERVAARTEVTVRSSLVDGAYAARGRGDTAEHDRLVSAAVETALRGADAVVLAQASMAAALGPRRDERVLTSPESALTELLTAARAASTA